MRVGIEVEGRFKGLRSVFVTAQEWCIHRKQILRTMKADKIGYHQLYIIDRANILDLNTCFLHMSISKYIVTVERSKLEQVAPEWMHIVLSFQDDSFRFLKKADDVKLHNGWDVAMCNFEQMVKSKEADFVDDEEIDL